MNLRQEFSELKQYLSGLTPEGIVTVTIADKNTGELMDLAIEHDKDIVKPFTESMEQNFYYFVYEVKKNVFLKVKSELKKCR
ncbi:MAG: hypothetical protein V4549_07640 [Bacteroidota bacterium]